jgi:hypothetical protein
LGKFIDLTGQRFGRLVVIERAENNRFNQSRWLCKCDCGEQKIINTRCLASGDTVSCGCYAKEARRKTIGESSFNSLYNNYRLSLASKTYGFKISKEEFKEITSENCFYCGIEPKQFIKCGKSQKDYFGNYFHNGIDRIDSEIGYVLSNLVPCCKICNYMKKALGQQEFLEHIEKIHNYQKEKNETE